MPDLTFAVTDVVHLRLEALSSISGKTVDALAHEALDSFTSSFASRRAIVKARQAAAKAAGTTYSLADLGWVDGYAGQTVDELLAFDGTDAAHSILFALEQAIQKKQETDGLRTTTGVEFTLLSVQALQREVNNGGYDQFFRNSSVRFAPRIVDDLVRIGCIEVADLTQQALDSLDLPDLTVAAIQAAMDNDSTARDRALERCSTIFYGKANLSKHLLSYIKAHPGGIHI